jgi:hypothetical protein
MAPGGMSVPVDSIQDIWLGMRQLVGRLSAMRTHDAGFEVGSTVESAQQRNGPSVEAWHCRRVSSERVFFSSSRHGETEEGFGTNTTNKLHEQSEVRCHRSLGAQ